VRGDSTQRTGKLTERFDRAVAYAAAAHDEQRRKGTDIPYAAHLLGVASLVLEAGGGEDEAIAALLHDVVEDQGGAERLADVTATFGERIAGIVQECSAEDKTDDPGWRVRKERYIAGLSSCSASALVVSAADKLYNARAILDDYRALGPRVWDRFNADEPKGESILWYYQSLVDAYRVRIDAPARLISELGRTVTQLGRLMSRPSCPACGAGDVVVIAWGMPTLDAVEAAEDDVEFGGCIVGSSDYRCQLCGTGWPDPRRPWR
jgi:hypothetical protein